MNRIGRIARGGTKESTATNPAKVLRTIGRRPIARPKPSPMTDAMAMPVARRRRLAAVSDQNRMRPERRSGSATRRPAVSTI